MNSFYQILLAFVIVGGALVLYIDKLNDLTRLRLEIPHHVRELKILQEENQRLQYEIDQFESPLYLMELLKKPEFSHLKFPSENEVLIIEETP